MIVDLLELETRVARLEELTLPFCERIQQKSYTANEIIYLWFKTHTYLSVRILELEATNYHSRQAIRMAVSRLHNKGAIKKVAYGVYTCVY